MGLANFVPDSFQLLDVIFIIQRLDRRIYDRDHTAGMGSETIRSLNWTKHIYFLLHGVLVFDFI